MIEAIGTYDPHLKPPSYHELRVPLLKKKLEYTKGLLRGHEEERIKYGCSVMSDGWRSESTMARLVMAASSRSRLASRGSTSAIEERQRRAGQTN